MRKFTKKTKFPKYKTKKKYKRKRIGPNETDWNNFAFQSEARVNLARYDYLTRDKLEDREREKEK